MASPAVAEAVAVAPASANTDTDTDADLNGLPDAIADAVADASQPSALTTKRKREDSDDGHQNMDSVDDHQAKPTPLFSEDQPLRDEKNLIKNYFQVLQSLDITPSILKRPLSEPSTADEPLSKKQKSDDGAKPVCIEDKVNQDAYKLLDQLVLDLNKVIGDKNAELRSSTQVKDGEKSEHAALAQLQHFKEKALELHSREIAYPQLAQSAGVVRLDEIAQEPAEDKTVLTIFGLAPQGRHLFSSLPKQAAAQRDSDGAVKSVSDFELPDGVHTTAVLPAVPQRPSRVPNLGDMFPAPATLPPLEAPKPAKTTTKGNVLGFYHPELTDRSAYGHTKDSYYLKELSTGVWLDYSNSAPPNKTQSRRRERALSQNSSAVDAEVSEMDALFRGAFSSFAPEKDDSGAVISSGALGRLWYQRQGYRYMQQMMEAELDEPEEDTGVTLITPSQEEEIAQAVENWDESLVDPSLGEGDKAKKAAEDKEVEETLQDISDLIETLASYQRNRHLTLPTDPGQADTNGSQAPEPSDEERETYQMLKDQLAVIIASLPPYAVARLNADKLEGLNVSTKIEVRGDVYKGVMEEDETSARLRHQQQQVAQAQTPRQAPQRAPSFHSAAPYQSGQQYNRQYQVPNQTPVPVPNYQQSPVRAQPPQAYQRQASAPMAGMTPQPHRTAAGPFTRPTGWNGQQSMQPLRGYNTPSAGQSFQGTPNQPRAASSYQPQAQPGTPGRYSQAYPGYNPQQQPQQPQQQHGVQSQYQQQHSGGIPPHMNGAGLSPQRNPSPQMTMSPQVSQFSAAQSYASRPAQQPVPQARPYGTPGQPSVPPASVPRFPTNGVHPGQSQSPAPGGGQGAWPVQMTTEQRMQYQAQQRALALERTNQFNSKMQMQQNQMSVAGNPHPVSGLGGIGISAQAPDMQKMHMRASQFGGIAGQSSPSPRIPGTASPASMNGGLGQVPSPSPGPMPQGATPSPAPSAALAKPPTPV
ncbi:unnamed protein product [Discula destructiva]